VTHEIVILGDAFGLWIDCSCREEPLIHGNQTLTLDELNRLAHEHIEGADRAPIVR
jgi:hypothetical protein